MSFDLGDAIRIFDVLTNLVIIPVAGALFRIHGRLSHIEGRLEFLAYLDRRHREDKQ